jgi:DNA-binding transcriptional LysR family regulator
VARHERTQRGALELDSITAVVAMVSAGLGVALLHLVDTRICQTYPVRFVAAGRDVPVMQTSLVTRKSDAELRTLDAVREAMRATLTETLPNAGIVAAP